MAVSRRESLRVLVVLLRIIMAAAQRDLWQVIVQNSGVCAMHAALMHTNRVVMFDRTDFGPSPLTFPDGYCRNNSKDLKLKKDCTAHSIVLDLATSTVKPLKVFSDPWCSSGSHQADGTLLSTGGWNDGYNVVRTIGTGANDDWKEFPNPPNAMLSSRWYASNAILPDNRVIVVGGRRAFSYEFVPRAANEGQYKLDFLYNTNSPGAENNLYPFLFLNTDGNIFIMANQDAILLNYKTNKVVRTYPKIPGGPRNYPGSAGMVTLPLSGGDRYKKAEVMVCGGTTATAYLNVGKGVFETALSSCGRMVITSPTPQWTMVNMPTPRVMGDMLNLPNGEILIINGAMNGSAGWKSALGPNLTPLTYDPIRNRFFKWKASTIPRLYHSIAIVLPDGKVLVAGSNPNVGYEFNPTDYPYPTELRIETYSPFYLSKGYDLRRPKIVASPAVLKYNVLFKVSFALAQAPVAVMIRLYAPSFTTHTYSMNQRMLVLKMAGVAGPAANQYTATVTSPPSTTIAPPGYYLLTVTNHGTPSSAVWAKLG